jgi:nucleotide-binding universal stress UspA family protein
MAQEQNYILVTWDFTEKSEYALEHAVLASKRLKSTVGLVHIVKKASDVSKAEKRINDEVNSKYPDLDPKPQALVREGNIFSTITEFAEETGAIMVFMGTHGIKGMQKFLGSWALKVIAHTKVPFIVVQEKPKKENPFQNIVIPLTFRNENKECINWANFFSRYFSTQFYLFKAQHTDSRFKKGIESNVLFLTKYFNSRGISCEVKDATSDSNFVDQSIQFCKDIDGDGIMIIVTKDIGFTDYVLGAHEQYIIANDQKIPVICINPKPPKLGGSFSASGG